MSTSSLDQPTVLDRDGERWMATAAKRAARKKGYGPLITFGIAVYAIVIVLAILVPLLWPIDAYTQNLTGRLQGPFSTIDGEFHLFGTDSLGRDVFARLFLGARYSLVIATASVLGAMVIGTLAGVTAGYRGGRLGEVIMRLVDLQLAFPMVLLALALVGLLGASATNVVIVFVLTGWPIFARTVRASTITLRDRAFVDAARTVGASSTHIVWRHILPNALGTLVVVATFELAKVLIYESSLSFLGLGVQPPAPTWGNMMAEGRNYIDTAWWLIFVPGITLVLTAAAANWLGDGLNQRLDPRARQR
jgi:peptide/nickel transport system permease protein